MISAPKTSHIQIRPMRLDDLQEVQAIDRASFSLPWPPSSYRYELEDNQFSFLYVAEDRGGAETSRVVGMIVVWMIMDESHIATLAVLPEFRRKGISQLLLKVALIEAIRRGARLATLEVRASNRVAHALYRRFRFAVVGRRPRYYQDNQEDALIMTVDLQQKVDQELTYQEWLTTWQPVVHTSEEEPPVTQSRPAQD
jgi:ribosomal-protein-alanine N-acetyltransferase